MNHNVGNGEPLYVAWGLIAPGIVTVHSQMIREYDKGKVWIREPGGDGPINISEDQYRRANALADRALGRPLRCSREHTLDEFLRDVTAVVRWAILNGDGDKVVIGPMIGDDDNE